MFKKSKNIESDLFRDILLQVGERKSMDLSYETAWFNLFNKEVFNKIDEEIFRVIYKSHTGRPNQSIRLLVSMLILKEGLNLTDEQLFDQGRFDMRVMRALGQKHIDSELPATSTYYAFKKAVLEYNEENNADLMGDVFNQLAAGIVKSFNIQGEQHIRMDSKLFSSNIAKSTRLELIIKCLQQWHESNPDQIWELDKKHQVSLGKIIGNVAQTITYRMPKPEQNQLLQELIEVMEGIRVRNLDDDLTKKLYTEQVEKSENQVKPKDREEISGNSLQSPFDIEAAYRTKGHGPKKQEVIGYVSNITETCDSKNSINIVTHIKTKNASNNDEGFFKEAIEASISLVGEVTEVTTDGGYNSQQNKKYIESNPEMKWNLQNMQGDEGGYIFDWEESKLMVTDIATGERLEAHKTPTGKYCIKLKNRTSSKQKGRYFCKETIDNYFRRQEIKENIKYTSQSRANVESTIHHGFYTLKNKKTKYRGLQMNHMYVVLRYTWVNFKRLLKKIEKEVFLFIFLIPQRITNLVKPNLQFEYRELNQV